MKRLAGLLLITAGFFAPAASEAQTPNKACALDGVRAFVADAGDTSVVEISARVKAEGASSATCKVDWSLVSLASPDGSASAPTIAIVSTFFDHRLQSPLVLADGVATAAPREQSGDVTATGNVFSVRFVVEGTKNGLRVEIPRHAFPKQTVAGARFERRVKSARDGTGRFGTLGEIAIVPSGPGAAGGLGPTGPILDERVVLEMLPKDAELAPLVPLPKWAVTLDVLRGLLPLRVLDLSTSNQEGWNEVAKRAYAAALHGDPVVATIGVHTLAWLGSGLSLDATSITKLVPTSVSEAIGDPQARLQKQYGATGHLLPLGRPSTFRKALAARPWLETARATAARDAVTRLGTISAADLAPYLVPPIMEGTAPVDPPPSQAPVNVAPLAKPNEAPVEPPAAVKPHARRKPSKSSMLRRRRVVISLAAVGAAALLAFTVLNARRRSSARPRDGASFDRRVAS